jgi:excisionase family DNA binding protein
VAAKIATSQNAQQVLYMETISEHLRQLDHAITTDELAALWNLKPWTIREWIRLHKLAGYKTGNQWRVDPSDALKCWEARKSGK